MYAVELFFDKNIERYVKGIWEGLKINGISSYMADIEEIRPHITVSIYNSELPVDKFIDAFNKIAKSISKINVRFDVIATSPPNPDFPKNSLVYAPPIINSQLFETHRNLYNELLEYNTFANKHYLPEQWNPHCTISILQDKESLMKTLDYCINHFQRLDGKINEIGIVKLEWSNGTCVSSKTIFSNVLS